MIREFENPFRIIGISYAEAKLLYTTIINIMIMSISNIGTVLDNFDRSRGSGSRNATEDWLDDKTIYDNEWGSTANTTFRPFDEDGNGNSIPSYKQRHMKRLYERQNGKGDTSRKETIRQSYIENDLEIFMSVLEMSEYEKDDVRYIFEEIGVDSNTFGSWKYEKILLTICSLVADKYLSNQKNASIESRLFMTDRYKELMNAVHMSSTDHRKLRVSIREKSDYF